MQSWYEDDRFWEIFARVMFTEQRWAAAPVEIDHVPTLPTGIYPGSAILDLACEPGRHPLTPWIYSASELTGMLIESGFSAVEIYGDLERAPYDHTAKRLVALAQK